MFETTLNKLSTCAVYQDRWAMLLARMGKTQADDTQLPLLAVLDSNGLDDVLECLCAVEGHDEDFQLFGLWCAAQVRHLLVDERLLRVLDVFERLVQGNAHREELNAVMKTAPRLTWTEVWGVARGNSVLTAWYAVNTLNAAISGDVPRAVRLAIYAERTTRKAISERVEKRFRQMLREGAFIRSAA